MADLVVEVVSPGSRSIDRGEKYYEYERGGVREYWLIDHERQVAEFYVLGRGKVYRSVQVGDDGFYRSTVLKGFWIKIEWLWSRDRPPAMKVLRELGL